QDGGVGTVVEEIRLHGVTLSADIPYPRDPRRRRAVIAMAGVAGGSREGALHRPRVPVHALLILLQLVRGNPIRLHIYGVSMAATAHLRHTHGVNARSRVRCRADRVCRMTTDTRCDFRIIECLEALTVCRGIVLGHLVHAQCRIVAFHELRITMTVPEDLWEVLARRDTNVSFGGIHGFHAGLLRVPAVTGNATEAAGRMDISAEGLYRMHQPCITSRDMAGNTTVMLLPRRPYRPR